MQYKYARFDNVDSTHSKMYENSQSDNTTVKSLKIHDLIISQ